MPNPLLFLPPAHTVCYAAGTALHRGPTQLPALDIPIKCKPAACTLYRNGILQRHKAWATVGDGSVA
eukprot:scaffold77376_cov21-Tisochrysis_lutea.AAC.1